MMLMVFIVEVTSALEVQSRMMMMMMMKVMMMMMKKKMPLLTSH